MEETWKPFNYGSEYTYEISNLGNCRRMLKKGQYRYLAGSTKNTGYKYIKVTENGKKKNRYIHQLVAYNFLGNRPEGLVIDHQDRDKTNNHVNNLRYVTCSENVLNCDRYSNK